MNRSLRILVAHNVRCDRPGGMSRIMRMIHDRVDGDEFLLTHDIISQMLGAQRTGVTEAAGHLQKKRMIRYSRGKIAILDRQALEEMACECYWIVKEEFDHLTGARNSSY